MTSSEGDFQEALLDAAMYDLFCVELETQSKVLNQGLIEIEQNPQDKRWLESLMRAAHSIKGAARVVNLNLIVQLAHALEDCFVAAQNQQIAMTRALIDQLLTGVDFFIRLSKVHLKENPSWLHEQIPFVQTLTQTIAEASKKTVPEEKESGVKLPAAQHVPRETLKIEQFQLKEVEKIETKPFHPAFTGDRVLRITAQNLNRLMGLAGEFLIESRWLYPFGENLQRFKKSLQTLADHLDTLRHRLQQQNLNETSQKGMVVVYEQLNAIRDHLNGYLSELDHFIRRYANLSDQLYQEVINSSMRPFSDGVVGFPRMVRDLAHQLGKQVRFEIEGKSTPVDRDILERLEVPLGHLLRNAIDHGIESPEERVAMGKPVEGLIKLEAHHRGGMLAITVSDDGRGIDIEQLRQKIVEKKLASEEMASHLSETEVTDFLFLPGFSTAKNVTEISGRGVGLDVVQNSVQEMGGNVKIAFLKGHGVTFYLQLPLTLSVVRTLLVEISGEAYAFPLARIDHAFILDQEKIQIMENRQYVTHEGQNIGLILAWQVLALNPPSSTPRDLPVIIISDRLNHYGLIVDRLMGEKALVVQELDSRLGKIPDIIAGSLMEDGLPVLIVDIDDMIHSIDHLLSGDRLTQIAYNKKTRESLARKRILVVDDSMTVREVESRLLKNQGYDVETAVNGLDGWNAVRMGRYDLVITDIDMPRMNGIELLRAIKSDPKLQSMPVMVVSYKEREEDRLKGLKAGADYYLTKGSFHDETLIHVVNDLIGKP